MIEDAKRTNEMRRVGAARGGFPFVFEQMCKQIETGRSAMILYEDHFRKEGMLEAWDRFLDWKENSAEGAVCPKAIAEMPHNAEQRRRMKPYLKRADVREVNHRPHWAE